MLFMAKRVQVLSTGLRGDFAVLPDELSEWFVDVRNFSLGLHSRLL